MNQYLVLVTIGPVQDFIASARKLRDLWFGSYLLSELSKTVARELASLEADLIFPYVSSMKELEPDSSLIVGNKILSVMKGGSQPIQAIQSAKKAWTDHQQRIVRDTLGILETIPGLAINRSIFEQQALDSGEFFAAWTVLNGNYKAALKNLEKLLAGRKNTREFAPPLWDGAGIPKNSLDGIREAVTGDKQGEIRGLLKKNERLDAMGCIKRFNPLRARKSFDDLTQIAISPFLEGFEQKHNALFRSYLYHFLKNPETIDKIRIQDHAEYFYLDTQEIKEKGALEQYNAMKNAACLPPKYACILLGDGDNMGKAIDTISDAKGHQTFTRHLSSFASAVEKEVDSHGGSLIYAGGDDVLAYVPLHKVLECSDSIRKLFATTMDQAFSQLNMNTEKPTFSIGVAIVHHSAPLDVALDMSRQAERAAKKVADKNALAVVRSRRGKQTFTIKGKWDISGGKGIVNRLNAMCELYKSDTLPATLAYQLRQIKNEAGDALDFETGETVIPKNAASALVLRLLGRKNDDGLLKDLVLGQTSVRSLSDELVIAHEIARVQKMSKGEKP